MVGSTGHRGESWTGGRDTRIGACRCKVDRPAPTSLTGFLYSGAGPPAETSSRSEQGGADMQADWTGEYSGEAFPDAARSNRPSTASALTTGSTRSKQTQGIQGQQCFPYQGSHSRPPGWTRHSGRLIKGTRRGNRRSEMQCMRCNARHGQPKRQDVTSPFSALVYGRVAVTSRFLDAVRLARCRGPRRFPAAPPPPVQREQNECPVLPSIRDRLVLDITPAVSTPNTPGPPFLSHQPSAFTFKPPRRRGLGCTGGGGE